MSTKFKCEKCYEELDIKCESSSTVRVTKKPTCLWFPGCDPDWEPAFESEESISNSAVSFAVQGAEEIINNIKKVSKLSDSALNTPMDV